MTSFCVKPYNLIHMAAILDLYVEERVWCRSALLLCTQIQINAAGSPVKHTCAKQLDLKNLQGCWFTV